MPFPACDTAESMERQPFASYRGIDWGQLSGQAALAGALLALAGAAWVATDLRMAGMDAGPGTDPGALGFFLSTWVVMMAAMMLPAVMPMVLAYRTVQHQRAAHRASTNAGDIGLFLAGYLAVWAAAGLLGYALLEAARHLDGAIFAWHRAGRYTAAGVLLAAALYQLTPSKQACLSKCRSRRAFLTEGWRDGLGGALHTGIEHGAWCVGCCWGLMAALFALGAMSIDWMVVVAVLIALERLLPWRALATAAVATLLAALALGVAGAPWRVPMLTIPGGATAMRAMGSSQAHGRQMPQEAHMPAEAHR